jgi:hypothetical protein
MNTGLIYSEVPAVAAVLRGKDKMNTVACELTNDLTTYWFSGV